MTRAMLLLPLLVGVASAIVCLPNQCDRSRCVKVGACENGYVKEKAGMCGCCDACITYIDEGKPCFDYFLMGVPATTECRKGTYCSKKTYTCEKTVLESSTPCLEEYARKKEKQDRNPGMVGISFPTCDSDGTYAPVQCVESQCYCAHEFGHQLKNYGFSVGRVSEAACKCAREEAFLQRLKGKRVNCDEIGNYKPRQCTGSVCYCVDPLDGSRFSKTVHIGQANSLYC